MAQPSASDFPSAEYLASSRWYDASGPMTDRSVVIGNNSRRGGPTIWPGLLNTVIRDDSSDPSLDRRVVVTSERGGNLVEVCARQLRLAVSASSLRQPLVGELAISNLRIASLKQITIPAFITGDNFRAVEKDARMRMLTVRLDGKNLLFPANQLLIVRKPTLLSGAITPGRDFMTLSDLISNVQQHGRDPRPYA